VKSSSIPVVPPSGRCMAWKVRVPAIHSCSASPPTPCHLAISQRWT
jgi:hypothetical protein